MPGQVFLVAELIAASFIGAWEQASVGFAVIADYVNPRAFFLLDDFYPYLSAVRVTKVFGQSTQAYGGGEELGIVAATLRGADESSVLV